MQGIATTALLVAAIRAREQSRPDRLFDDPFAATLAGDEGFAALASYRAAAGPGVPIIEVRTRFLDDALARITGRGVRQVVLLAAGMDARAYRIAWPAGTRLFELDQPEMIAEKARLLAGAAPRCARVAIPIDLRTDWTQPLIDAGFDRTQRTAFLIEGLFQYLPADAVASVLARVDALAAPGSSVLFDVVAAASLELPVMQPAKAWMAAQGAPWIFGVDDPRTLFAAHAWDVALTETGVAGHALGRWPFPVAPPGVPGVPRNHFVEATKR
jgi:methyltransferase (TIGR00027 family)